MPISNWLNILGLCFDIIGAAILFKYGLPSMIEEGPPDFSVEEAEDEKLIRETRNTHIKRMAKIGLAFLIAGFTFQLISNLPFNV
jgi:hypothetical protein